MSIKNLSSSQTKNIIVNCKDVKILTSPTFTDYSVSDEVTVTNSGGFIRVTNMPNIATGAHIILKVNYTPIDQEGNTIQLTPYSVDGNSLLYSYYASTPFGQNTQFEVYIRNNSGINATGGDAIFYYLIV